MAETGNNTANKENHDHSSHQIVTAYEHFEGPLPHPRIIDQYEKIYPGAAKIIFDMAVSQTKHRQKLEDKVVSSNVANERLGMWLSFISLIALTGAGFWLIFTGKNVPAGLFSFFSVVLVQGANFFFRKRNERKELQKKKKQAEQPKQLNIE